LVCVVAFEDGGGGLAVGGEAEITEF
jgi:hypothetical protein